MSKKSEIEKSEERPERNIPEEVGNAVFGFVGVVILIFGIGCLCAWYLSTYVYKAPIKIEFLQ